MFGAFLRAALSAAIAVVIAAILGFVAPYLLPYMGPQDELLYQSFKSISDNSLIVMILAICLGLLARAVVEANPRRLS